MNIVSHCLLTNFMHVNIIAEEFNTSIVYENHNNLQQLTHLHESKIDY